MKKKVLILIFLFFGYSTFSQNLKDTLIHIDEVKITDSKITKTNDNHIICSGIIKIDSDVMAQNTINSLSELLLQQTPVFIKSYGQGSLAVASIRGAGASHTQILWNGILLNNPMTGQTDLSLIPIFFIEKAEISSGGNSLNTVSGALGGSINLLSDIRKEKFFTELIQTAGNSETYQTFAKIGGGTSKFKTSIKLFHEQSENNFNYLNTANGLNNYERQNNAAYLKNGLLNEIYFNISGNQILTLKTWVQRNKREIPPIMSYQGAERIEIQEDNSLKSSFAYHSDTKNFKNTISGSFSSEDINYSLSDKINTETYVRINSVGKSKQVNLNYSSKLNYHKKLYAETKFTLNYQKSIYSDKKTGIGYAKDRKTGEFFISSHFQPSLFFIGYSFVRITNVDFNFLSIMPLAGIEYQPIRNIPLTFSNTISRNFHQPTLNDLYWIPGGNPDLKPEEGYSSDFTANYQFKNTSGFHATIRASMYASVIKDQIIWQPGDYGFWTAKNIQRVFSRGIETSFSLNYELNKIKTALRGNYSYTKSTNQSHSDDNDNSYGMQLIYTPLHKANMHFNITFMQWTLRITDTYTGIRFTNSAEENSRYVLPSFNLLHLNFGRKFKLKNTELHAELRIKNLLNIQYQEILWRAMPGRQYLLSVKFEFHK